MRFFFSKKVSRHEEETSAISERVEREHEAEWVSPFSVLMLLCGMFFLIYLDRGAIASNGVNGHERSKEDPNGSGLQGEFDLTNLQDGLLSSMFMVGMSVAIPICSEAIYVVNAFRLLGISLLIWTVAIIACGVSFDFYSIAVCRMFVGVGEAAVISLAPPYIDDHAPPEKKTLWLACLFFAVPAGFSAGYGYGALMGSTLGWRSAFIAEAILMSPFVIFSFSAKPLHLNMKNAHGEEGDINASLDKNKFQTFLRHASEIFSHRVYGFILAGYITYTAFIGIIAYWGAKAAKAVFDLHDMATAAVAVSMGSLGTILGGLTLDTMGSSIPGALYLSAFCSLIPGAIMLLGFIIRPTLAGFLAVYSISLIFLFSLQAPVQAAILWCVPINHRTLANGLSVLTIHLLGDVPAPPLFGALLDYFKHTKNMAEDDAYLKSLCITSSVLLVAGILFLIAAQIGKTAKDYRLERNTNGAANLQSHQILPESDYTENESLLNAEY